MQKVFSKKYFSIILLLTMPANSKVVEEQPTALTLSQQEHDLVINNPETTYAYLGSELSNVGQIVKQIASLYETDSIQGVQELNAHLKEGYKIAQREAVIEALAEVATNLDDNTKSREVVDQLVNNINKLQDNLLSVEIIQQKVASDEQTQKNLLLKNDQIDEEDKLIYAQLQVQGIPIIAQEQEIMRDPEITVIEGSLEVTNDAFIERNLAVGNSFLVKDGAIVKGDLIVCDKLEVGGKAKFKKNVQFRKDVEIKDDLEVNDKLKVSGKSKFKKDAKFKQDVEIEEDLLVEKNLTVLEETFLKDVEVDGNLSVIEDLVVCGDTQLKGDAEIDGELSVVEDLVVCGNAKFKGSVVDIACDLRVGCNILLNETNSPVGTFLVDGLSFLHTSGIDNTFLGRRAGNFSMTGDANSGFGAYALLNTIGRGNTAIGAFGLRENTTGECNTALGLGGLLNNTTGFGNVAVGVESLLSNEAGSYNTAIGKEALLASLGNENIGIGYQAGETLINGNKNIYVGSDAAWPTESDTIRVGTSQTDCYIQGIHGAVVGSVTDMPVFVDATGKLGTATSSENFKSNIIDMGTTSDDLMNLRPVRFTYNHDTSHSPHYGLIAEEVKNIYPELVVCNKAGNSYAVRYHELPAMLLNELQKLYAEFQLYVAKVHELENIIKKGKNA